MSDLLPPSSGYKLGLVIFFLFNGHPMALVLSNFISFKAKSLFDYIIIVVETVGMKTKENREGMEK